MFVTTVMPHQMPHYMGTTVHVLTMAYGRHLQLLVHGVHCYRNDCMYMEQSAIIITSTDLLHLEQGLLQQYSDLLS